MARDGGRGAGTGEGGGERGPASVAAPSADDLEAFAERHAAKKGPQCQGCRLPDGLRAVLRAGRAQSPPHPYTTLAAYAASKGYRITSTCLRDHFGRGHEEAA